MSFVATGPEVAHAIRSAVRIIDPRNPQVAITGVNFQATPGTVHITGSDGFRLSSSTITTETSDRAEYLIPALDLKPLLKQIEKCNRIAFRLSGRTVELSDPDTGWIFAVLSPFQAARFPNYEQLIPRTHTAQIIVDRKALLAAVRAARPIALDGICAVALRVEPKQPLVLYAQNGAHSYRADFSDADIETDARHNVAFHPDYLRDALLSVRSDSVFIGLQTPSSPALFRPVGAEHSRYAHVIMPMFIDFSAPIPDQELARSI